MSRGKSICNVLKTIRKQVADANDIKYEPRECDYEGECRGTCPACEAEVKYISQQLDLRRQLGKAVAIVGISAGLSALTASASTPIGIDKNQTPQKPPKTAKQGKTNSTGCENEKVLRVGEVVVQEAIKPDTSEVFGIVEQMPVFRGGQTKLMEYLDKNIKYPKELEQDGVQGRVVVNFVVEKNGSISEVKVIKGLHPLLDKEAARVVSSMPKWMPGKQNGTTVRVKYTLPITFKLK